MLKLLGNKFRFKMILLVLILFAGYYWLFHYLIPKSTCCNCAKGIYEINSSDCSSFENRQEAYDLCEKYYGEKRKEFQRRYNESSD